MRRVSILVLVVGLGIMLGAVWPDQAQSLGPVQAFLRPSSAGDGARPSSTAPLAGTLADQPACTSLGIGLSADLNDDGEVNAGDLAFIASLWRNPEQYDPRFDVAPDSPDGIINVSDLTRVAAAMGSACPLRFLDDGQEPLANTMVRVLCYATPSDNAPLADLWTATNVFGRPLAELPAGCDYVAALRLRHEQSSGKPEHGPAYRVYATSWSPGSRDVLPLDGDVSILDARPLVLFDVVASLEWEPAAGSPFLTNLETGLLEASDYLYDLTDGQMAFGPVDVHAGGELWDGADLRFRVTNDYRPSAYVGGIVAAPRPYTATVTGKETVYVPGEVLLGRYWNGESASDSATGSWSSQPSSRTLVHEWAHYALFLYDEYFAHVFDSSGHLIGEEKTYCTCTDLPDVGDPSAPGACGGVTVDQAASAMAFHYTASEFWNFGDHGDPLACQGTAQDVVHGEPDWETLSHWGTIQGLATDWIAKPASLAPGPSSLGLAGDLFELTEHGPTTSTVSSMRVGLRTNAALTPDDLNSLYPQVYVVEGAPESPDRILYQGTPVGERTPPSDLGPMRLLGVAEKARARVFADRYKSESVASGGRFVYPLPGAADPTLTDGDTLLLEEDAWQASLDVTYTMVGRQLTDMTLTLTSCSEETTTPIAQLCTPDAGFGCPDTADWRRTMTSSDGGVTWTTTFSAPPGEALPHYGVLQVRAPDTGELIRWFQAGGGVGPAHMEADAPLVDGLVRAEATQEIAGEHNRMMVMPAANCHALSEPLPAGIGGLVGAPLDLDILLPDSQPHQPLPVPVVLTLFYNQDVVDQLGIQEDQLELLHFDQGGSGAWSVIEDRNAGQSNDVLNWLASLPVTEDGIYAVGWRP